MQPLAHGGDEDTVPDANRAQLSPALKVADGVRAHRKQPGSLSAIDQQRGWPCCCGPGAASVVLTGLEFSS